MNRLVAFTARFKIYLASMEELLKCLAVRLKDRLGTAVSIADELPPGTEIYWILTRADIQAYDEKRDAERKAAREAAN